MNCFWDSCDSGISTTYCPCLKSSQLDRSFYVFISCDSSFAEDLLNWLRVLIYAVTERVLFNSNGAGLIFLWLAEQMEIK